MDLELTSETVRDLLAAKIRKFTRYVLTESMIDAMNAANAIATDTDSGLYGANSMGIHPTLPGNELSIVDSEEIYL